MGFKDFWNRFVFRPKDLRDSVDREDRVHKAKVICFSVAMGALAGAYQGFFDGLTYRSAQMQGKAMAGQLAFLDYKDYKDPTNLLWQYHNDMDVLEDLDLKQVKMLTSGWQSTSYPYWEPRTPCQSQTSASGNHWDLTDMKYQGSGTQYQIKVKNPATNQDYAGNLVFDYCTSFSNGHYARYTNNVGRDDKVAGKTVGDPNAVEDWNENGQLVGIKFTQTSDKVCDDSAAPPGTTFRLVTKVRCDKTKVVAIRSLDWTGKTLDNFCTMEVETTHSSGCTTTNTNPVTRYAGPNGSPYDNSGLFTQKQRYNDFQAWLDADAQMQLGINNIVRDSKKYDNWEKMHNGVIWYDTAGCWGKHIGAANSVQFSGRWTDTNGTPSWWTDINNEPDADSYTDKPPAAADPAKRKPAWDTALGFGGFVAVADESLYKDYLKDLIELMEDCDVDCQAKGSQLTMMASLMGAAYGIVGLNALFMFIGTWRWRWRVCSVYCTFFACLFQFAILIAVGACLFTKYNAVCARSLTNTGDPFMWTMADDFYAVFVTWILSWIWMFVFVCCGMCSAFRAKDF